MAIGNDRGTLGNCLSLTDGNIIKQGSTNAYAVTVTLNSSATTTGAGYGLVVRRPPTVPGTSGGEDLFLVDRDGVRGRRRVITLSSASTAIELKDEWSGAFVLVPAVASGLTITLPNVGQGLSYELYAQGAVSSGITTISAIDGQMVVFNDSAANDWIWGKSGTASGTQVGNCTRFVSDGSKWYVIPEPSYTGAAAASDAMSENAIVT